MQRTSRSPNGAGGTKRIRRNSRKMRNDERFDGLMKILHGSPGQMRFQLIRECIFFGESEELQRFVRHITRSKPLPLITCRAQTAYHPALKRVPTIRSCRNLILAPKSSGRYPTRCMSFNVNDPSKNPERTDETAGHASKNSNQPRKR